MFINKGGWGGGGVLGRLDGEKTDVFTFPTALFDLSIEEAVGTPPSVPCLFCRSLSLG